LTSLDSGSSFARETVMLSFVPVTMPGFADRPKVIPSWQSVVEFESKSGSKVFAARGPRALTAFTLPSRQVVVTVLVEMMVEVDVRVEVPNSVEVDVLVTVAATPSVTNNVAETMMAATTIAAARSVKLRAGAALI
jgi:hypothetical protein